MSILNKSSQHGQRLPTQPQCYLIKIHISPHQEVQIAVTQTSDIDSLIQNCIDKYGLKLEAHAFLKKRIMMFMQSTQRCRTDYDGDGGIGDGFHCATRNPLRGKQGILRELKIGDIDRNKVSIQRTPKNADNLYFRKERSPKNNLAHHPRIYLKKKAQSEKQNISTLLTKNSEDQRHLNSKRAQRRSQPVNKSAEKCKKQSVIIKDDQEIADQNFQFLDDDRLFSPIRELRLKTETQAETSMRLKEFSLQDLEKEMNQQVIDLKYEKKIRRLEPQLCNLFRSIIRYNPPKVHKIDPRYACFEDLSQKIIKALHEFLINLKDDQLNSLDFDNLKKLLIKYRSDSLLDSLK